MKNDPFGNLTDWGQVLEILEDLSENGKLAECQHGLVRILRYKGNWRLREEVLKCVGKIQAPTEELVSQVLALLADDNIYFDARVLAGDALIQVLKNVPENLRMQIDKDLRKVVERLMNTQQPIFFHAALDRLYSEVCVPGALEN